MGHYAYLPTHYTTGCGRTGGVEIGGRKEEGEVKVVERRWKRTLRDT